MAYPKEKLQKRTFTIQFVTYLCLSLTVILLVLPVFYYYTVYNNIKTLIVSEQSKQVAKSFWALESALGECQLFAFNISTDSNIGRIRLSEADNPDLVKYIYDYMIHQQRNLWENSLAQEVIIQFRRNNVLFTRYSVYQDKRVFYDKFFNYSHLTYEQWQEALYSERKEALDVTGVTSNGTFTEALTINYYYPSTSEPSMVVSFILPSDKLLTEIKTEEIRNFGSVALTIGNGQDNVTLAYDSGLDTDTHLVSLTNFQPPLSVEADISSKTFSQAAAHTSRILFMFTFLSMFALLALSAVFTWLNIRPLKAVIHFISQLGISKADQYRGNIYSYINQTMVGIVQSGEQYKKTCDFVQTTLEHTVFSMAVKGLSVSAHDMDFALGSIPALKDDYLLAGVANKPLISELSSEYHPDETMNVAYKLFSERAKQPYLYLSDILYVVLNVRQEGGDAAIGALLESIHRSLSDVEKSDVYLGVSKKFTGYNRLGEAAEQVNHSLVVAQSGISPPVVWYEQSFKASSGQVAVNEEALFQALMQPDKESINVFFGSLLKEISLRHQTILQAKTIYYTILATCQKAVSVLTGTEEIAIKEFDVQVSTRCNLVYLRGVCQQIHDCVGAHRNTHKTELSQKILEYIKTHYASPDLCLTMVADYFSLSERYISALVHEETGRSYGDHVIDIRMGEAKRLLAQTATPVVDIGILVGYDRSNSFYKAFKRCTGTSPHQYRTNKQSVFSKAGS